MRSFRASKPWEQKFGVTHATLAPRFTTGADEFRAKLLFIKEIFVMRSDLVFRALSHVSNRYQLCQLASKATRKLHRPNTRVQDTANAVFARFQSIDPAALEPLEAPASHPTEERRAA
jgi:hypothetical protein